MRVFLITSGSLGIDDSRFDWLVAAKRDDPELYTSLMETEYYRRLHLYYTGQSEVPPWEGITWILDLLPHFPKKALEGLNAYFLAHAQSLPDGRLCSLHDAAEIIRARFIGIPGTQAEALQLLVSLDWRDFEHLVERLYESMGYETKLTPAKKDKGRDVIASRRNVGKLEHLLIECKKYVEEPIGLNIVQRLLGVVAGEKVNKGVLVTTSRFTEPAQQYARENPRLELIAGEQLVILMNEHLGPSWPLQIDRLITDSKREQEDIMS